MLAVFFNSITIRAVFSLLTGVLISFILTNNIIKQLVSRQIGQSIREEGPEEHKVKSGTPTMGGISVVIAVVITSLFWAKINTFVIIILLTILWLAAVGFMDDILIIKEKNNKGLSARKKLLFQTLFAAGLGIYLYMTGLVGTELKIPTLNIDIELGKFYILFVMFVVVGSSNSVNLTDGLDGLATGILIIVFSVYTGIVYIVGNSIFSKHLFMKYIAGAEELTIFCTAIVGALIGFLWYNAPPAQIFMGDTGSLAFGGSLGVIAILSKSELLLVVIGGIFVIEAISVILQVGSYKLRKKRIFLMAPIHHHFEKLGLKETKVVMRFWIVTLLLALVGIGILGLNVITHKNQLKKEKKVEQIQTTTTVKPKEVKKAIEVEVKKDSKIEFKK
jgi:phospho-N-acetylmuramoyl-pentapeptide-transferase